MIVETDLITSLCMVNDIGINKAGLIRVADLINGKLVVFEPEPGDKLFENRDRIFRKSGPEKEGFVGIWEWTAIENTNSPGMDYVDKSIYKPDLDPIQIIRIEAANSPEEMVPFLQQGVNMPSVDHDVIFANSTFSKGIYCKKEALEIVESKVKVKKDQISFPVVRISKKDVITIHIYPGGAYYSYLTPREVDEYVYTMDPVAGIKTFILQEFTKKKFQATTGGSIKEFKQFKEIVDSIGSNESIVTKIKEIYRCDSQTAKEYIEEFQKRADELIDENDVSESMLEGIVANSRQLAEKARASIEKRWEEEHQKVIKEKEAELRAIEKQVEDARVLLAQTQKMEQDAQEKIKELTSEAERQKALGDQALQYVHEKINSARNDVAKFIAERIMYSENSFQGKLDDKHNLSESEEEIGAVEEKESIARESCLIDPSEKGIEAVEKPVNIKDLLFLIEDNLDIAGVDTNTPELAAYLLAAYLERCSLLVAGPGSEAIVYAFSASIIGKKPLILDCGGPVNKYDIQRIRNYEDDIILVRGVFNSEWKNSVINLIDSTDKMIFCVYPFTEDLFMEPRSLYSYMFPLFTEPFIGRKGNEHYYGNDNRKVVPEKEIQVEKNLYRKLLKRMRMGNYVVDRMERLFSWFRNLLGETKIDLEYLYCLFPYAVVTESAEPLMEDIRENKELSKKWKEYFSDFFEED